MLVCLSTYVTGSKCQYQLQHKSKMEQVLCDRIRQNCLLEENRLSHLEEQFQQAQQQADDAFKEVHLTSRSRDITKT